MCRKILNWLVNCKGLSTNKKGKKIWNYLQTVDFFFWYDPKTFCGSTHSQKWPGHPIVKFPLQRFTEKFYLANVLILFIYIQEILSPLFFILSLGFLDIGRDKGGFLMWIDLLENVGMNGFTAVFSSFQNQLIHH